jgi:outer membrane protein OmpA-like peptidoglycan-associated protein
MIATPLNTRRVVARADQDTACGFAPVFVSQPPTAPPERYEGATGITLSSRLLAALETGQHVYVRVTVPAFGGGTHDRGHWVHRVEPRPVGIPVILNDHPVTLPAVHAQCDTTGYTRGRNGAKLRYLECEYYVLDDPRDPVILVWRSMTLQEDTTLRQVSDSVLRGTDKTGFRAINGVLQLDTTQLEVVHIDEAGEQRMEQALSKQRKVIVYGIYFEFGQAMMKQASGPVLHEIADIMRRNPTWSLSIDCYTDSIGGDADNLALSRRRARAVRDTLVTGFGIAANRLSSAGFGSASPVDSNATLEGRARNRRVELIRR